MDKYSKTGFKNLLNSIVKRSGILTKNKMPFKLNLTLYLLGTKIEQTSRESLEIISQFIKQHYLERLEKIKNFTKSQAVTKKRIFANNKNLFGSNENKSVKNFLQIHSVWDNFCE